MRSQAPCQKDDFMERNSSRRSFLKGSALTGAAYVLGRRVLARPNPLSVIVVGAGAFSGWTALELLRKGAKVVLVEAWGPGNSRASSGGDRKSTRLNSSHVSISYAVFCLKKKKKNRRY